MLSKDYECIFIHIPKTAGQSIEHVFLDLHGLEWENREPLLLKQNDKKDDKGPSHLAHLKATDYLIRGYVTENQFNEYFKFAFVRNPWDRVVSFYKYLGEPLKYSFSEYVKNEFRDEFRNNYFVQPQNNYVYEDGQLLVDFIGKFERLQEDFNYVRNKIGIENKNLPHVNSSSSFSSFNLKKPVDLGKKILGYFVVNYIKNNLYGNYQDYYDKESKEIVRKLYQKDIRLFEYSFC